MSQVLLWLWRKKLTPEARKLAAVVAYVDKPPRLSVLRRGKRGCVVEITPLQVDPIQHS